MRRTIKGMRWFVNEVWPIVKRSGPTHARRCRRRSDAIVRSALCPRPNDRGHRPGARCPSMAMGIRRRDRAAASRSRRKNKALEAIAAGLPIVITSAVADGLPFEAAPAASVAESPEAFAQYVLALLSIPPEARRARASLANLGRLQWATTLRPLGPLFDSASQNLARSVRPSTDVPVPVVRVSVHAFTALSQTRLRR